MAWFASKGAKYYIRLTAKTISCSAACENSYAFNCRRVRSHRKHPARLRFTPAPSTARPVIISQTGILALLRLCLMYFLIPIAFPSSSFFPSTWHKHGKRKKPGGGVKRLRGNCTRSKQPALTTVAESVMDHHQRWQRRRIAIGCAVKTRDDEIREDCKWHDALPLPLRARQPRSDG